MGSGMPEIGSRISLISKADIRYEGKLFSVDPEECTIALSSVRSYGTEDRETEYPVPAQSQVYDYILFRGSDIKDIRVLTTTIPNDPAIVQLSVPPSLSDSQFQSRTGYPAPPLINMSNMPNAPSTSRNQASSLQNSSFPGGVGSINITHSIPKPQNVVSEDESRSSTPSTQNAKTNDAPARVSTGSTKEEQNHPRRETYTREKPQGGNRYQQGPKPQQYQQRYQQQSRYPQQSQQQQQRYLQQPQYREYNRDGQYRSYNEYRDSYAPRQYMQPLRNTQRADNWVNYGQRRNNPNRMGQSGQHQQQNNYQSAGGYQNQNRQKPKNTLKFESDYDFEQANTEFEQMRTQLEKTKLEDSVKMNGDLECKKEESGDEATVVEEAELDGEDKPVFYDKVRSFFDQISYEAIERSKGHTQRMDWKTERKINSETFGSMALRRNANFRGRPNGSAGGYYNNYQGRNMSMANNFRGGYNRQQQSNQRRQFNVPGKSHESGKENRSS